MQNLVSVTWETQSFILKAKLHLLTFKLFLIAWLREYCTFSDSSVVSLKSSPWPKYTQLGTILKKKIVFHYQTFFSSSNMVLIRLFLANTGKKIGRHCARLIYFAIELSLRLIAYVLYVHALMYAR